MIVDTSVLIAIYQAEQDARGFVLRLLQASERHMSAASFVEAD